MKGGRPDIAWLRQVASAAVAASSLRAVAEDIGMSWSGLRSFLDGTQPQAETIAKLVAWSRLRGDRTDRVTQADMQAAAALLAEFIEGARSPEGRDRRLLLALRAVGAQLGPSAALTLRRLLQ